MPNRILRDWTNSDKINDLSVQAERFFTRLIMKVDDFGCFYADTRLLKANLFPLLLDSIREADLLRWMTECQKSGLIVLYNNTNKKYLQIIDFRQRLDKAKSKYPLPLKTDFPESDIEFPSETETESETKPKTETESERPDLKKIIYPFESENFLNIWKNWKEYKGAEHRFKFKSEQSEQAALNELVKVSKGHEDTAIEIIKQSMANGWKGFFELKNNINGKQKQPTGNQVSTASAFTKIDRMFGETGT